MSRAICILGMHRSGTSVISRAINLLGAYIGEDEELYPPAPDNQRGVWERKDIVDLHNRILFQFGGAWHTVPLLPDQWYKSERIKPFRDELIELISKHFSNHQLWVWKDPRTCLLFPLWQDVLDELGIELSCIYVVRNPLDVVKSHYKRNGFSYDKSFGLWLTYNLEALQSSHSVPRYFMSYDSFLSKWENELRKCSEKMEIYWPKDDSILKKEMSDFIHPDLRHSASKQDDLKTAGAPQPVLNLYQLLEKVMTISSISEPSFINEAERLYQEFFCYRHIFQSYTEKLQEQLNHKGVQINQLQTTIQAQQEELNSIYISREWRLLRKLMIIKDKIPLIHLRKYIYDLIFKYFRNLEKGSSNDPLYNSWILKNEPDKSQLRAMSAESQIWSYRPKVSIITPVCNPTEHDLTECLNSVLMQIYQNWELCIVDGGSDKPHVREVIKRFANRDSRIKYVLLPENKGIAGNSNEALKLATGEYVAFLDHDDMLAPFALYEVVKLLNQDQTTDLIFSDEDKVSAAGRNRFNPFFKPEWSPDTVLSYNYLCHFAVVRRSIIEKIGGFREGFDGAQDYDLILRITLETTNVKRIPKILYHWRASQTSIALSASAKPLASDAGKRAISEYLQHKGLEAEILDGAIPTWYRVKYSVKPHQRVSIIIPAKDQVYSLRRCISSILSKTDYKDYEILIVDNQSKEQETYEYFNGLKNESHIKILQYDKPLNFSAINNFAVQSTDGDYILFLNNGTEVINSEWLSAMLEFAQREDVGAVGAKLYYPDDTIQHAGVIIGLKGLADYPHRNLSRSSNGYFGRLNIIQNFSAVSAGCMMMRRKVFMAVGGFDERISHAFSDIDLCLKIREKGYLIVYTPYAELYHYESARRGVEATVENIARANQDKELVKNKWKHILDSVDPHYNPNLTLDKTDFSIRL